MFKAIVVAIVIIFAAVYFVAPDALKPWKEAAVNASKITANVVQSTGEAVNKTVRDEAHKDSIVDKTKDRVSDAVTGTRK